MSVQDVSPELDKLEAQLDNLEACLEPLLENLSGHASQLPLVDRAKLYTLTNYALESLLFCGLYPPPFLSTLLTSRSGVETAGRGRSQPPSLHDRAEEGEAILFQDRSG